MGSWVTYGLGSASENLPAYVVMPQPEGTPEGGTPMLGRGISAGGLSGDAAAAGRQSGDPFEAAGGGDAGAAAGHARFAAEDERDGYARRATGRWRRGSASYELAFRMQSHAPEAVDLSKETEATRRMYGLEDAVTREFGTRCLLARRMVERGVRFVQIFSGGGPVRIQWDAHNHLMANHEKMCGLTDQPIAALLKDLKSRGLLDSTLVIWGSEFGRLPMSQVGQRAGP